MRAYPTFKENCPVAAIGVTQICIWTLPGLLVPLVGLDHEARVQDLVMAVENHLYDAVRSGGNGMPAWMVMPWLLMVS